MKVHKVVYWDKGPKGKRVQMVQASFTDETGHHTNHMTLVAWLAKTEASYTEAKPGYKILDVSPDTEDTSGVVEEADVGDLRTDFESA